MVCLGTSDQGSRGVGAFDPERRSEALEHAFRQRSRFFQLWNIFHRPDGVRQALDYTLKALQVEYLDFYLMHWPVATLVKASKHLSVLFGVVTNAQFLKK